MTIKKVIITGSEGTIGREICGRLKEVLNVIKVSRSLGHDLTDENFVKDFFKKTKPDYLINLFALNDHVDDEKSDETGETLMDCSLDSFREYLNVNLTALLSVCREFARNNEYGGVINFSSIYGLVSPIPSLYTAREKHIGYSVSKAGVIHLSKHLAVHLAPNIRVNCVVPGGVINKQDDEFIKRYCEQVPIKRMMKADELIGILEYLCSEKSSYTTGSTFVIDGGWTSI